MGGKKAMVFGAMGVGVTAAINGVLFHSEFYSFPLFVALNVLNNTMQPLGSLSVRALMHACVPGPCRHAVFG